MNVVAIFSIFRKLLPPSLPSSPYASGENIFSFSPEERKKPSSGPSTSRLWNGSGPLYERTIITIPPAHLHGTPASSRMTTREDPSRPTALTYIRAFVTNTVDDPTLSEWLRAFASRSSEESWVGGRVGELFCCEIVRLRVDSFCISGWKEKRHCSLRVDTNFRKI